MSELTRKEKARAMRNGKMKMANEGCVWTAGDDMILQGMFDDGEDNLDMALILERKEPAIQQRIDQLGLYHKQKRTRTKKEIPVARGWEARRLPISSFIFAQTSASGLGVSSNSAATTIQGLSSRHEWR